eukprot:g35403.t1
MPPSDSEAVKSGVRHLRKVTSNPLRTGTVVFPRPGEKQEGPLLPYLLLPDISFKRAKVKITPHQIAKTMINHFLIPRFELCLLWPDVGSGVQAFNGVKQTRRQSRGGGVRRSKVMKATAGCPLLDTSPQELRLLLVAWPGLGSRVKVLVLPHHSRFLTLTSIECPLAVEKSGKWSVGAKAQSHPRGGRGACSGTCREIHGYCFAAAL